MQEMLHYLYIDGNLVNTWAMKKQKNTNKLIIWHSIESWLFKRDPYYDGFIINLHIVG